MQKILIVEDDIDIQDILKNHLIDARYEVAVASDGVAGIAMFDDTIDLVLLDIMLPKITGLAVLHEIRQKSSVPVLMLTAIEDEYTQVPAICLLPLLQIRSYSRPSKVIVYKIMPRTIQR